MTNIGYDYINPNFTQGIFQHYVQRLFLCLQSLGMGCYQLTFLYSISSWQSVTVRTRGSSLSFQLDNADIFVYVAIVFQQSFSHRLLLDVWTKGHQTWKFLYPKYTLHYWTAALSCDEGRGFINFPQINLKTKHVYVLMNFLSGV